MRRPHRALGAVRVFFILAFMVFLYYAIPFGANGLGNFRALDVLFAALGIIGLAFLITVQARALLGASNRQVRVEGLVVVLVVIVLFFSVVYLEMAAQFSGLSTKTDALYFTMVTIGTVGYGDIHAVGQGARVMVSIQIAFDLVYVAALANVFFGVARARAARLRDQQLRESGTVDAEPGQAAGPTPAGPA